MKSFTIIILGGTGDLAKKKLLPAINTISKKDHFDKVNVVVIGRRDFNDEHYMEFAKIKQTELHSKIKISYFKSDFSKDDSLKALPEFLLGLEKGCIGRIFYLATSPNFFGSISKQLSSFAKEDKIFNRIMIEKPFGHDLESSIELKDDLEKYFSEEQIYRVDHYLGKDTVQNILVLRLSNPFFERTWNSESIEKIEITVNEDIGVGDRLGYYEDTGLIRDMIQNHLLQIAAFILMEPPKSMESQHIHDAKVLAIEQLRFEKATIGQYEGYIDELSAVGKTDSNTETYAEVHLRSDSKRWHNTPIILRSGKNLDKRYALIEIFYRKEPCILYCDIDTFPNRLVLNIQPVQDIEFYMNTKIPKRDLEIKHIKLNFSSECEFSSNSSESYENILEECIIGDKTLFISSQEIEAAWKLVDNIREHIKDIKPLIYKKGSKGPIISEVSRGSHGHK